MHKNTFQQLYNDFPALATQLIQQYLDQSKPYNADFAAHPDEPRHHKPQWHQWGIITHTYNFLHAFDTRVQACIDSWNMREQYTVWSTEMVDGIHKEELLRLGILYHDLGKITARHLSRTQHTKDPIYPDFSFGSHEAASEELIQEHLAPALLALGYSPGQIIYIGRCAALHYEIAKIRDRIKHSAEGYSLRFVETEDFAREAKLLHIEYQDYAMEVGLMYLGDSFAKTQWQLEPTPTNDTQRLVHPQIPQIKEAIAAAGLIPSHLECVLHVPVSMAAVKRYFELMK